MDTDAFSAAAALLGRPVTEGERRAMAAQAERLAAHLAASPLAAPGGLFTAEAGAHAALIAALGAAR